MIKLKKLLKENPDHIDVPKYLQHKFKRNVLWHSDLDSRVFGYWKFNKKFYMSGTPYMTHVNMWRIIPKEDQETFERQTGKEFEIFQPYDRNFYKYAGRLWEDAEVITFWDYPKSKSELRKVLKDIKKNGIRINDDWYIEVVDKKGKYEIPLVHKSEMGWKMWNEPTKLVKIKDYIGSEKQLGIGQTHTVSPIRKKVNVPKGWGSRKKVPGKRKGEVPAATRFRLRRDWKMPKLKDLLFENIEDIIENYETTNWTGIIAYHGTSKERADSIKKGGYKIGTEKGMGKVLGYGLNFTEHADSARVWALGYDTISILKLSISGNFLDFRGGSNEWERFKDFAYEIKINREKWNKVLTRHGIDGILGMENWFHKGRGWTGILYNLKKYRVVGSILVPEHRRYDRLRDF